MPIYDALFAADYKMNLIQPATLSKEDLARFANDFALVMKFLKIANDKKKIKELLDDEGSPYTYHKHVGNPCDKQLCWNRS